MTVRLYGSSDIASMLNISKQAVNEKERKGQIAKPAYIIGRTKGWTLTQVRKMKEGQK